MPEYAYIPAAISATEIPTLTGSSGVPVIGQQSGLRLHQQVICLPVSVGTTRAIAGDPAYDQPRMCLTQRGGRQPEPLGGARARFCTKTSLRSSRRRSTSPASGCLTSSVSDSFDRFSQTKCDDCPADGRIVAPREIPNPRALDLDDPCAQIGELTGCEGCRHRLLERKHGDPVERISPRPGSRFPQAHQNDRGRPSTCWPIKDKIRFVEIGAV